jgi:hypothetical protein
VVIDDGAIGMTALLLQAGGDMMSSCWTLNDCACWTLACYVSAVAADDVMLSTIVRL